MTRGNRGLGCGGNVFRIFQEADVYSSSKEVMSEVISCFKQKNVNTVPDFLNDWTNYMPLYS